MGSRPEIKPWLRPFGRRPGEVQFGVTSDGVIVSGVTSAEIALLARLDGSLSRNESFLAATAHGVPARRWRELLDLVAGLDLLVPEPSGPGGAATLPERPARGALPRTVRRTTRDPGPETLSPAGARASALARAEPPHVLVDGTGGLSDAVAAMLRHCEARVTHGQPAADLVIADPKGDRPGLVVVVGIDSIDPRRGDLWLAHAVPALPVVVAGERACVGPVLGSGPGAPCLWCLHLHRTDRDVEWPTLMAQLHPQDRPLVAAPLVDPAPGPLLSQLIACTVAMFTELVIVGDQSTQGVSVDLSAPWPRMDHRRWTPHPRCPHHTAASVVA